VVVGTGKSSICVQFVDNHFVESYNPTIENTFVKDIKHKGVNYAIELVDTAGQVSIALLVLLLLLLLLHHQ
jgi:small GTP-binding protein